MDDKTMKETQGSDFGEGQEVGRRGVGNLGMWIKLYSWPGGGYKGACFLTIH